MQCDPGPGKKKKKASKNIIGIAGKNETCTKD